MQDVSGKDIWIIGASSGIGRALAIELHGRGAKLILSARSQNKLDELNKKLGGEHKVLPVDVSDHKALSEAAGKIPNLDSVILMAAVYAPHSKESQDIDFIHDIINVNIGGAFNTVNAVHPLFKKKKHGQIVLCGSVAGYRGLPFGQPYSATKSAIISYAESLKVELKTQNIDVKVINPGFVRTPMTDKNDFSMPMMIEPEKAAEEIAEGLGAKSFEIHFPKKFTLIMKFLRLLPSGVYFWAVKKILSD